MLDEVAEVLAVELALEQELAHGPPLVEEEVVLLVAAQPAWVEAGIVVVVMVAVVVERVAEPAQGLAQAWAQLLSRRTSSSSRRITAKPAMPRG